MRFIYITFIIFIVALFFYFIPNYSSTSRSLVEAPEWLFCTNKDKVERLKPVSITVKGEEVQIHPISRGRYKAAGINFWDVGEEISVSLVEYEDINTIDFIQQVARIWEEHANITFNFLDNNNYSADIRISTNYIDGIGASKLGITHKILENKVSMWLGIEKIVDKIENWDNSDENYRRASALILHEFGHALGLIHEHQSPEVEICWNEPEVFAYCEDEYGLNEEECIINYLDFYDEYNITNSKYDPFSIMHYYLHDDLLTCYWESRNNFVLSQTDKCFIREIYPFPEDSDYIEKYTVDFKEIEALNSSDGFLRNELDIYGQIGVITDKDMPENCINPLQPECLLYMLEGTLLFFNKDRENLIHLTQNEIFTSNTRHTFEVNGSNSIWFLFWLKEADGIDGDDYFGYHPDYEELEGPLLVDIKTLEIDSNSGDCIFSISTGPDSGDAKLQFTFNISIESSLVATNSCVI